MSPKIGVHESDDAIIITDLDEAVFIHHVIALYNGDRVSRGLKRYLVEDDWFEVVEQFQRQLRRHSREPEV